MAWYMSCSLLPIVWTILEHVKFVFYPLHNLNTVIFPKKDTVTELREILVTELRFEFACENHTFWISMELQWLTLI